MRAILSAGALDGIHMLAIFAQRLTEPFVSLDDIYIPVSKT